MQLRTCRSFQEMVVVIAVARVLDALGLIERREEFVFRYNLGVAIGFCEMMNKVNRRMDRIESSYHELIARAKVEGLAAVQADRRFLRRESRRMCRMVRRNRRLMLRLPWPARFFTQVTPQAPTKNASHENF